MVVNFRNREISQGTRKLTQIFTLIKKKLLMVLKQFTGMNEINLQGMTFIKWKHSTYRV
jgi:hypothetical protein